MRTKQVIIRLFLLFFLFYVGCTHYAAFPPDIDFFYATRAVTLPFMNSATEDTRINAETLDIWIAHGLIACKEHQQEDITKICHDRTHWKMYADNKLLDSSGFLSFLRLKASEKLSTEYKPFSDRFICLHIDYRARWELVRNILTTCTSVGLWKFAAATRSRGKYYNSLREYSPLSVPSGL